MGTWIGLLFAGVLNGSFAVPMKTARSWTFYHIWGTFSLLSMAVIPFAGVAVAVPGWTRIIAAIPSAGMIKLVILGLVWGVAALLYGAAVELLGVALGVSILLGLSIVVGALLPRLLAGTLLTPQGHDALFGLGLLLMVIGVIVCSRAGSSKTDKRSSAQFRNGLIVAILGGIGSPVLNIGIQYGITLLQPAASTSSTSSIAHSNLTQWVAWALFLTAAAVSQTGYCFWRVFVKGQQATFTAPGAAAEFGRVAIMAVAWSVSIFVYGSAVAALGPRGPSQGWPVFIALIVLTSNVWGVMLGEWREKPRSAFQQMLLGSSLLVGATFLIARAG
jgi:L-rhamnose-H+ transport protein